MKKAKPMKDISALGDAQAVTIASGVVLLHDSQVLLVKSRSHGLWQFPGGSILPSESLKTAAQREIQEETGLKITLKEQTPIVYTFKQEGTRYMLLHFVHSLDSKPALSIKSEEIEKVAWFFRDSLPKNLCPNVKPIIDSL